MAEYVFHYNVFRFAHTSSIYHDSEENLFKSRFWTPQEHGVKHDSDWSWYKYSIK